MIAIGKIASKTAFHVKSEFAAEVWGDMVLDGKREKEVEIQEFQTHT